MHFWSKRHTRHADSSRAESRSTPKFFAAFYAKGRTHGPACCFSGAPWRIRTVDLGIRSPLLYPTELMEHKPARQNLYRRILLIDYNLLKLVVVRLAHLIDGTVHAQITLLDPNRTLADTLNLLHGV